MSMADFVAGSATYTDIDTFRFLATNLLFVDIGYVTQVLEDSRVNVNGYSFIGTKQEVFTNIEVLYPCGYMQCDLANSVGLIFVPKSCLLNSLDNKVSLSSGTYALKGAKFVPLRNGNSDTVTVWGNGNKVVIGSNEFAVSFVENGVVFKQGDYGEMVMYSTGFCRYSACNGLVRYVCDETGNSVDARVDKKVLWARNVKADGTIIEYYKAGGGGDGLTEFDSNGVESIVDLSDSEYAWENVITYDVNGCVSVVSGGSDKKFELDINGTIVSIDNDGKVTLNCSSITLGSDLEIDCSSSNYTIAIKNTGKFSVNNTDLEVT